MNATDFQSFFKSRMVELLDRNTLDSYRVRVNNAHTIVQELSTVIKAWIDGSIKRFETVQLVIDECCDLLSKDDCMSYDFYDKNLFLETLKDYSTLSNSKKDTPLVDESKRILFLLEEFLQRNKSSYLPALIGRLQDKMFMQGNLPDDKFIPELEAFDSVVSSFACELLSIGYTKKYLYKYFKAMKDNKSDFDFSRAFDQMKRKYTELQESHYTVVIKLQIFTLQNKPTFEAIGNVKKELPPYMAEEVGSYNSFLRTNKYIYYYIEEVDTYDACVAAKRVYEHLATELDQKQDDVVGSYVHKTALVLERDAKKKVCRRSLETFLELDNGGQFLQSGGNLLSEKMKCIMGLKDKDAKDRVNAALRHLRVADSQGEIEQRFINYWIALEFIFASSSSSESTYERIKTYLVRIMTTCYTQRNWIYLYKWMEIKNLIKDYDSMKEVVNDDEQVGKIDNVLLKYRIKNVKSHMGHSDKLKKHIQKHRTHLLQHISRIYRLRNELVHEAALKQDIENVTSNLRFYLVFVLNQMIEYFSAQTPDEERTMLKFFWQYEKYEKSIEKSSDKIAAVNQVKIAESYIV